MASKGITKEELISTFKFYRGKNELSTSLTPDKQYWWSGEKVLFDKCQESADFWNSLEARYDKSLASNSLSGLLVDASIPKNKRIVVFFLDLWNGRRNPYDLDAIFNYIEYK